MSATQSDYMHWAKFKRPVRFGLTASEVPHFRMDSLPISISDLELDGASHPRYLPLRERIAGRYGVTTDEVVTSDGTSMANFLVMAALISAGDDVLIEKPAYELLLRTASFLGATVRRFERQQSQDFALDPATLAKCLTPRTRLIVTTNLHNPTGVLADEASLRAIGEVAASVDARILVDEVYLDAAVPQQRSAAQLGPHFVITNSLTKVYGLSGLRCGWVLCEPVLAERLWRLNDLFSVNQAHAAERLGCIAFDNLALVVGDTPAMLERNRRLFNDFVASRSDIDCAVARHGITAFPRWHGGDTQRLDEELRAHHDSSVVAGHWFEMPDRFRIGFGLSTQDFAAALSRLCAALDALR